MSFKSKMKKKGNEIISQYSTNPFPVQEEQKNNRFPLWAKISIPSILATGIAVVAIVLTNISSGSKNIEPMRFLNEPKKEFNANHNVLSQEYLDSINCLGNNFFDALYDMYYTSPQSYQMSAENILFSPISLYTTLSALYDQTDGNSKQEIGRILGIDETKYSHLEEIKKTFLNLSIDYQDQKTKTYAFANLVQSLFVQNEFVPYINSESVDIMTDYYFSELACCDLNKDESWKEMSDFVKGKTNGRLTFSDKAHRYTSIEGVESLNNNDLEFINILYIESSWATGFYLTNSLPFYNYDGTVNREIKYLSEHQSEGLILEVKEGTDYTLISIPLKQGFNLNILLPNEGTDYQRVMKENLQNLLKCSFERKYSAFVHIRIPEFKMNQTHFLDTYSNRIGINFDELNLDYLIRNPHRKLNIGVLVQECSIDLNVNGVSALALGSDSITREVTAEEEMLPTIDFFANRPFIYSITSAESIPLFIGQVQSL